MTDRKRIWLSGTLPSDRRHEDCRTYCDMYGPYGTETYHDQPCRGAGMCLKWDIEMYVRQAFLFGMSQEVSGKGYTRGGVSLLANVAP